MKRPGYSIFSFVLLMSSLVVGDARAENIFEMLFGGFANRNTAPAQNTGGHSDRPRVHVRAKPAPPPIENETAKYLRSPEFSRRFVAGQTDEALAYMLRNDPTLRSGDAVMTKEGLRVFDPKGGEDGKFLPLDRAELGRTMTTRLADIEQAERPAGSGIIRTSLDESGPLALRAKTKTPDTGRVGTAAQPIIRTADGRSIRLVGGFVY